MDTTHGLAATPAGQTGHNDAALDRAGETPAQATQETYVTLADDVEDVADGEDNADHAETADGETGDTAGEAPRRKPGSARLKERVRALERENEDLCRNRQAQRAPADDDGDLVEPKERDFPGDYLAYDRALRAYQTTKAIRDENRRVAARQAERAAHFEHRERVAGYNVRLETVKDRIPDFDRVMREAGRMDIRNDVRDLILDSPKGPLLAYHLARNPDKVADLNRMSAAQAAKEIGGLEARIRGPNPKTVTSAKAPPRPMPAGGTASRAPRVEAMSMEEYTAARKAGKI